MIEEDGYIKLIDYGLSKYLKPDQVTSTVAGTVTYMAPEIFKGVHDKNVDWFSLGCLMYELAMGVTPFQLDLSADKFDIKNMININKVN